MMKPDRTTTTRKRGTIQKRTDWRDLSGSVLKRWEMVWLMQRRDIIAFQARVTAYEKGYKGYRKDVYKPIEIDYRLSNPTKISKNASASDSTTLSTRSPEMGQGVERE